MTAMLDTVD